MGRGQWGKGFQEYGQNQGRGWKQGRDAALAGVGGRWGAGMQTTVIEQQ